MTRRHPLGQGANTALGLWGHAALHHPIGDQLPGLAEAELTNQGGRVVLIAQYSRRIGEQDQLLGLQRRRQLAGHRVGIDVVGLAIGIGGHAGDHRDVASGEQGLQHRGIHRRHVPHQAVAAVTKAAG